LTLAQRLSLLKALRSFEWTYLSVPFRTVHELSDPVVAFDAVRVDPFAILFVPSYAQTPEMVDLFLDATQTSTNEGVFEAAFGHAYHAYLNCPQNAIRPTPEQWIRLARTRPRVVRKFHLEPISIDSALGQALWETDKGLAAQKCTNVTEAHYDAVLVERPYLFGSIPRVYKTIDRFRAAFQRDPSVKRYLTRAMVRTLLGLPPVDGENSEDDDE
jgi:hypothetical protein